MAYVSALFIRDEILGPHLDLIRKIAQPNSRSYPHITVRFSKDVPFPRKHFDSVISDVFLNGAGAFGLDEDATRSTTYIKCECADIEELVYKPTFPFSEFHITLYDGPNKTFATELFNRVNEYRWKYRVRLPNDTALEKIALGKAKAHSLLPDLGTEQLVCKLFGPKKREWPKSDDEKLAEIECVLEHLSQTATSLEYSDEIIFQNQTRHTGSNRFYPELHDAHITPPELAESIVEYAVSRLGPSEEEILFGDPSVGTGAYFSALLRVVDSERISDAIGIDIDESMVNYSQRRWRNRGLDVIRHDYLHLETLEPRNLIVANPPYKRHQALDAKTKSELRERASLILGIQISALAGQYVYFLILSHEWMAHGAIAAWLVPTQFMQTRYAKSLREYLTTKVRLIKIHSYDQNVSLFENTRVDVTLIVFENRPPEGEQFPSISSGGLNVAEAPDIRSISIQDLHDLEDWRSIHTNQIIDMTPVSGLTMGDLFTIRRGIATGANNFFILSVEEAQTLQLPEEYLKPVLPKARNIEQDVITADSNGFPNTNERMVVIDCDLPEVELRKEEPELWQYLNAGLQDGLANRTLLKRRKIWYKQEISQPPLIAVNVMGRRQKNRPAFRAVLNHSKAIVTNAYLALTPNKQLMTALAKSPSGSRSRTVRRIVQRTLDSLTTADVRTHAGGLMKLEPREFSRVRISGDIPKWLRDCAELNLLSF